MEITKAEMKHKPYRPHWWRMDLIFLVMLFLIILDSRLPVPQLVHQLLLGFVVLAGFGAVMRWLWLNAESIQEEDDLQREAETLGRNLPVNERQALYRLALIKRDDALQRRTNSDYEPYQRSHSNRR